MSEPPPAIDCLLSNVLSKLQVVDRAEAAIRAREAGLGI
jgi:DNA-binding NarL/FixJ family response regulator